MGAFQTSGFAYQGAGAFAYQEGIGVTVAPVGVHKGRPIRLREIEKREDLGEYFKRQLNLRHSDLIAKPVVTKVEPRVAIAMKSMALEREQERLTIQANNDVLALLMMAEV